MSYAWLWATAFPLLLLFMQVPFLTSLEEMQRNKKNSTNELFFQMNKNKKKLGERVNVNCIQLQPCTQTFFFLSNYWCMHYKLYAGNFCTIRVFSRVHLNPVDRNRFSSIRKKYAQHHIIYSLRHLGAKKTGFNLTIVHFISAESCL